MIAPAPDLPDNAPEPEEAVSWLLDLQKNGIPRNTPLNVFYVLSRDSRWKGRIRTNDFDGLTYLDDRPITDSNLTEIVHWLELVYVLRTTEERVSKTAIVVGDEHSWHPVKQYLDGLEWDGVGRFGALLEHYFDAELPDDKEQADRQRLLLSALGRCWMISCVARIYDPGCKVDTTLILTGAQGAGKSTACQVLANPIVAPGRRRQGWFSDTLLDLHTKDLYESLQGVWIYELAELDAFNRADWSRIKAILSSPSDRWRRPYGRSVQARHRQVVFVGTTNRDQFLGDPTGSRRFWPVRVGTVKLEELRRDVEQLWAEAVWRFLEGENWWLDERQAHALAAASREFSIEHPWAELIEAYCANCGWRDVTCSEVLELGVKKPIGSWTKGDEHEVGGVLRSLGYHRSTRRGGRPGEPRPRLWTRTS